MSILKSVYSKLRVEEIFSIIAFIVVSFVNIFLFENEVGILHSLSEMKKYFAFGNHFYGYFFSLVVIFSIFVLNKDLIILYKGLKDNKFPNKQDFYSLLAKFFNNFRYIIPLFLILVSFSQLVSNISYAQRLNPKDILLAKADLFVTGRLLFIDLPNYFKAEVISKILYRFYISLSLVMSPFLFLLFLKKEQFLLRSAIFAFILSIAISYPIYYFIPSPGPHYSLLENVRSISIPDDLLTLINQYNPSSYVQKTTSQILSFYVDNTKDDAGIASSFPSMHATWGIIVLYFLYKIYKWTIFISVPWIIVMLTGGIYFGQHYFIDYLASIPISILSICLAEKLIKIDLKKQVV